MITFLTLVWRCDAGDAFVVRAAALVALGAPELVHAAAAYRTAIAALLDDRDGAAQRPLVCDQLEKIDAAAMSRSSAEQ